MSAQHQFFKKNNLVEILESLLEEYRLLFHVML
jgi:hypothetical protein